MSHDLPLKVVFFDLGDTLVVRGRGVLPGAREALNALGRAGLRLGVISNTAALTRPQIIAGLPAGFSLAQFEPGLLIFSSEVGFEKPDPEIFRLAVEAAAVRPEECLFCTEDFPHSLAAQRSGLHAARVQHPPAGDVGSLVNALRAAGFLN